MGTGTRMTSQSTSASAQPAARFGDSRSILRGVASILVGCGYSPRELERQMRSICSALPSPRSPLDPRNLEYVARLPDVIADWNELPLYVEGGRPRALRLKGAPPSVATLVANIFPEVDPRRVVRSLTRMGAVRRRGAAYECQVTHLVFRGREAYWRALISLDAIVRTLECNLTRRASALEQSTISARLPLRDRSVLHSIAQRRGLPVLHGLDAEMRRRARAACPGEPRTWAGLGMYVIDIPIQSASPRAHAKPRRPGARGRKRARL